METQNVRLENYINTEKGYTIEFPTDWKKNDVPQLDIVLFAPSKKNDEKTHASMNIVSEKVGNQISLEQFYKESAANLSNSLKGVEVEKTGAVKLNGIPSQWMLYTHTMQGIKFRVLQYFIVAQETIYLITFSSSAEDFGSYRQDFENIASTFKIIVPTPTQSLTNQKNQQ